MVNKINQVNTKVSKQQVRRVGSRFIIIEFERTQDSKVKIYVPLTKQWVET